MEGRPKRTVAKPSRYQTTSSDESLKRKKIPPKTITAGDIDEDIGHLRRFLENPDNSTDMDKTFNTNIYYTQEHTTTHSYPYTITNKHSTLYIHCNIFNITSTHTHKHSISYIHCNIFSITSTLIHKHSTLYIHRNIFNLIFTLFTTPFAQEKLSSIDAELRRMNGLLHNVLRYVQSNNDRDRVPRKPACLPISSVVEMDTFQAIDDDDYREVVNYFKYIGGFNLKEA
ncbi:hypothetical protein RF55_17401, partial [Lasius niger]